jgi:16S rRNA (guanine966-N2)-methyltransferase
MRIIAGKYGGRVLKVPEFSPTRPTTNIAKEALFNVIENYYNFDNIRFLDLFGGTGQLSYEMASRGCTDITVVEQFPKCVKFIENTIDLLEIQGMRVYPMDIFKYIKHCKNEKFDLIFAGPPYPLPNLPEIPDLIFDQDLVEGLGWFIMEHNPQHNFKKHPHFWKSKNYGQTIFSIFTNTGKNKD